MSTESAVQFIDLAAQRRRLGSRIDDAVLRVVNHGHYIMGPEVFELEEQLSTFCGAKHSISCANGTDALALCLMAKGVKPQDAILVPSFTFAATAEVVAWLGATPIFVDVDADTFNMSPASLEQGIATARQLGLSPRGVIVVDLFGRPADYDKIEPICHSHGLWLLDDAAQSFGARFHDRRIGTIGDMTATSFFPAKPLGCYGDGGAIFTDDDEIATILRSLRVHGQGKDKYDNVRIGMNGRLDTMQAAILIEKLAIFGDEIEARQRVADRYAEGLRDLVSVPELPDGFVSTWAQYTLKLSPAMDRARIQAELKQAGVPTNIYYPIPLHQQTAYRRYPTAGNGLPVSEQLAASVLSLPMHPYLETDAQDRIIETVRHTLLAQS